MDQQQKRSVSLENKLMLFLLYIKIIAKKQNK